jgi:hypothetical protein
MTIASKHLLLAGAALLTLSLPAISAEPNEPHEQLQFEFSDTPRPWEPSRPGARAVGPIRPTHVAEVVILDGCQQPRLIEPRQIDRLKTTHAGRLISAKQFEFLATSDAFIRGQHNLSIRNHRPYLLYAISAEDAQRTAEAFIELSAADANEVMQQYLDRRTESETEVSEYQTLVPELEAKLESAKALREKLEKEGRFLDFGEASSTIQEMNTLLNSVRIDIEGIQARIDQIHQFQTGGKDKAPYGAPNPKLDELLIVETIALKGALARQQAARAIRQEAKAFHDAVNDSGLYERQLQETRRELEDTQDQLTIAEEYLANPRPDMLPPVIYGNKITIYPVAENAR